MIGVSANGTSGSLQIVDASRDIRSNVEDTIPKLRNLRIFLGISRDDHQLPFGDCAGTFIRTATEA